MAIFKYKAIDKNGKRSSGEVEAINVEVAISSIQKRGLIIASIHSADDGETGIFREIKIFQRVTNREIVIMSRQMATLFESQISALQIFRLLATETQNPLLHSITQEIASDLQGGSLISAALEKHPKVFSSFYVSMVHAGEESGRLDKIFEYLADYLDRTHAITSKVKSSLIYPAFVILTFIGVMFLMMTVVIPKITKIITESGQEIPFYTKIVMNTSDFLVKYGLWLGILIAIVFTVAWRYIQSTEDGKLAWSQFKLGLPYIGNLYQKLYLSRVADNMNTMVISGIPMVQALEITANVVDDKVYKGILLESLDSVKGGSSLSKSFSNYDEIPSILVQMIKVGEETGELGKILATLAKFYRREVQIAVDTLVSLIEPVMTIALGIGVGILLTAILMPIYNISAGF